MLIKRAADVTASEITERSAYFGRRSFMAASSLALAGLAAPGWSSRTAAAALSFGKSPLSTDEAETPKKDVTSYNNYYEFGTDKSDPAENAGSFKTEPWTIKVEGEVAEPKTYAIEDVLKGIALEERIYRMRCVEGWSMVIPWVGFPLAAFIKRVEPTGKAKYIEFTTLLAPDQMPGQRSHVLDWPYTEGLRLDEAMNPLTLLAVGLYGETLPNQNGAPIRLVVPWKYGFKSIKAVVKLRFQEAQPATAWNKSAAQEYGFYSNVNPQVDHPRWSQRRERRIGEFSKRDTLIFNGYGEQVASLYAGQDLTKDF